MVKNAFIVNSIKSGDRKVLNVTIIDKNTKEPLDLIDRKVVFSIKRSDNSPDEQSDLRKEYLYTNTTKNIKIELESNDTKKLKGLYYCDLRISYPNSEQVFLTLGPSTVNFIVPVTKSLKSI